LGNDQASLNRLSQANLIRKNATAFAKASKRKDYGVNLVGVWINPRLALRSRVALPIVRSTHANEIFCKKPLVERVKCHGSTALVSYQSMDKYWTDPYLLGGDELLLCTTSV
jgi:hypothetical protein